MLGGFLRGASRLGHDEAAGAELQVGKLHHIGLRFHQGIFAADTAVGRAKLHERRRVGGAHDDVLHAGVANDELAAGVVKAGDVKAARCQACDGVGVKRPLRHGDAQRAAALPAAARSSACAAAAMGAFQEEREAGGGAAFAIRTDGVVVATAASQRRAQPRCIGFEHDAV